MSKPVVLAYCDPFSAAAGEAVRFMVSCEGAEVYECRLVRLLCCETGPAGSGARDVPVASVVQGSYRARRQGIDIGSYGLIESLAIDGRKGFALRAIVWPTRLDGREQAIVGNWHEGERRGVGLILERDGSPTLRIGDGNGAIFAASTGVPLLERGWYLLAASFDPVVRKILLVQRPLGRPDLGGSPPAAMTEADCHVNLEAVTAPFLIAAWMKGHDGSKYLTGGHFDGKIEQPRVLGRPLTAQEAEAVQTPSHKPPPSGDSGDPHLLATWDFSAGISSDRIFDRSTCAHHGVLVNCPTRAVTGHSWTGEEFDWRHVPEQYGAIHFHSDDLGDARWDPDFSFVVPPDMESGVYAARLSVGETVFDVPFVVRPRKGGSRLSVALLLSLATYTAYANCRERFLSKNSDLNQGRLTILDDLDLLLLERPELGLSTYDRHADGSGVVYGTRLRPVLNNRPVTSDIAVAYDNFAADLLIVDWLSRVTPGFDVITDEDLHRDGLEVLRDYRVVVTSTHPEYASKEMRDALDAYLAQSGRLIYLGGNGLYWRIAFHPETTGIIEVRRAEDGVRAWEAGPGEAFHSFTGEYGGLWRRQGRPPNQILGVGFIAQGFDASAPYERTGMSLNPRAAFIFEGVTSERFGDQGLLAGGAAGLEIDNASIGRGTPAHALTVARSVGHSNVYHLVPEEINNTNGFTDGMLNPDVRSDIVFFETSSGGAVFSVGSIAFAGALSVNAYDNDTARIMANVLRRFTGKESFQFPEEVTSVREASK